MAFEDKVVRFRIPSTEMRTHCKGRADHHKKRGDEKAKELPKFRASLDILRRRNVTETPTESVSSSLTGDFRWPDGGKSTAYANDEKTLEGIEREIENHAIMASRFAFYSEHIYEGQVFELNIGELEFYELIPKLR